MDLTLLLALLGLGVLVIPALGGDDDDDSADEDNTIRGTSEDDELEGTTDGEEILGFLGDDIINGNGGLDILRGSGGEDTITGGADRDEIYGGADNDELFGLGGDDTIEGGGGNDVIDAGEGSDIVRAGAGDDTVYGNLGTDTLRGEDDDDDLFLWGNEGTAFGGEGDDDLIMVTGRGVLDGVAGTNTFYALANDDDEQQTVAIIQELGDGDQIVMTIDTDDATVVGEDLLVTVTEGTINGIEGYNVEIAFADESDEPAQFETSRVFIYGRSLDIEDVVASIQVDVTVDAELTVEGAQATFDALEPDAPAQTDPVVTP
ncbi:calcium-binding protein [Yoonia sp. BS5-3]|uniref:Calcium-binding protein n=1 Tax=Yoonia phaeophyticola TaxID=3137369 RepID=A0ABZ2V318_9RHOB